MSLRAHQAVIARIHAGKAQLARQDRDCAAEFSQAAAMVKGKDFDALVQRGVSRSWLFSGAMRFGIAEIEIHADGSYEPVAGGRAAVIVPENPCDTTRCLFEDWPFGDLVAYFPENPERWWRRCLLAQFINPEAIERADYLHQRLQFWRSPLGWLRGSGRGIVALDRRADLFLHLGGVREVVGHGLDHAEDIDQRLRRPAPITRVLVHEQGHHHD